ncbi:hypothetical protein PGT21_010940 [Puccinia graminis f. sp. tritici]|uniref:Uncharacterized protein n=1 Tax=Puccinia graminis f. sp. tritici TaxID=56615 RepID=A0A5B0NX53_PUCGR|nr:hypothetical protein PGT21_010940 [Puccinia graminis f. sp. tritici]
MPVPAVLLLSFNLSFQPPLYLLLSICSTDLLCLAIESSACREFQLIIDPPPCPRSSLGPSKFETVKERLVLALLS